MRLIRVKNDFLSWFISERVFRFFVLVLILLLGFQSLGLAQAYNWQSVAIMGGGGSGAQATATVSNGVVTAVEIMNAGFGYTGTPTIQIDPPPIPSLVPNVAEAVRLDYSGLTPALTYQLQETGDLANWADSGPPFTATGNMRSQYANADRDGGFFRLSLPQK